MQQQYAILFVCLGNICRSPTAEGIFRSIVMREQQDSKFIIESCGTGGWHVGEPAHQDTQRIACERGVDLSTHRARQFKKEDLSLFNLVLAMDEKNLRDIKKYQNIGSAKVQLLREYDPEPYELDVPDPYFAAGLDGFVEVFQIIERCCENLYQEILK